MSLPVEITGKESPAGDGSALDALIDFYRSFNASDLKAVAANWADGEARTRGVYVLDAGHFALDTKADKISVVLRELMEGAEVKNGKEKN
jgi:hypothetical protein